MRKLSEGGKVKLPTFNGESAKFHIWWMRFQAFAVIYKFSEAIQDTRDPEMPDKEADVLDPTSDKTKIAARQRNMMAIGHMTTAFTNEALMNTFFQRVNGYFPSTNGCLSLMLGTSTVQRLLTLSPPPTANQLHKEMALSLAFFPNYTPFVQRLLECCMPLSLLVSFVTKSSLS